jgi:hypothetical protein
MTQQNTCDHCHKLFYPVTYYEGKRLWRRGRKACFECIPYEPSGRGKTITKTRNTLDGKRECKICKEYKEFEHFSPTNKQGNLNSYCKTCAAKKTKYPRQRFKEECIAYKGGKCIMCGYFKCPAALEFHHRNPTEKEFSLRDIYTVILTDAVKVELDKCDLLCSVCHKEVHYYSAEEVGEEDGRKEK